MSVLIKLLVDRSGSMVNIAEETLHGISSFMNEQLNVAKRDDIPMYVSMYLFDDLFETVYEATPIEDVQELTRETFQPRGSTSLYDSLGKVLSDTPDEKYIRCITVIITDGLENSSMEHTACSVKVLMEKIQNSNTCAHNFVYLGANQDAILEAGKIGIKSSSAINYNTNTSSLKSVYSATAVQVARCASSKNKTDNVQFTELERVSSSVPYDSYVTCEMGSQPNRN